MAQKGNEKGMDDVANDPDVGGPLAPVEVEVRVTGSWGE